VGLHGRPGPARTVSGEPRCGFRVLRRPRPGPRLLPIPDPQHRPGLRPERRLGPHAVGPHPQPRGRGRHRSGRHRAVRLALRLWPGGGALRLRVDACLRCVPQRGCLRHSLQAGPAPEASAGRVPERVRVPGLQRRYSRLPLAQSRDGPELLRQRRPAGHRQPEPPRHARDAGLGPGNRHALQRLGPTASSAHPTIPRLSISHRSFPTVASASARSTAQ
jgi:hypothetical protein